MPSARRTRRMDKDGLLKLDKITLEAYHFSVPRGLWSVQWVCNQVTDLLGLTNGKKLRTKRMTTQLKRVVLEILEASGRSDEIEDNFRDSQRSLRAAREEVGIGEWVQASGESSMSTYATMAFMAYVAAGSGALGRRNDFQTSVPKSEVRRRARAVMTTMIKAVVKEDTLWACTVNDITDNVGGWAWPRAVRALPHVVGQWGNKL